MRLCVRVCVHARLCVCFVCARRVCRLLLVQLLRATATGLGAAWRHMCASSSLLTGHALIAGPLRGEHHPPVNEEQAHPEHFLVGGEGGWVTQQSRDRVEHPLLLLPRAPGTGPWPRSASWCPCPLPCCPPRSSRTAPRTPRPGPAPGQVPGVGGRVWGGACALTLPCPALSIMLNSQP